MTLSNQVTDIVSAHEFVSSDAAAAGVALNSGTDLACETTIYDSLVDAVAENITTVATIDNSLQRLYQSLIQVGYFNPPADLASLGWSDVGTPHAQKLAYMAAAEGMTLLKNTGVLPLPDSIRKDKVAVIGPWANATTQMQGNYQGVAPYLISPLMAFQSKWSGVTFSNGTDINTTSTAGFADAMHAASKADYVIYCGGIDTTIEAEGHDRTSIEWPGNQLELIKKLASLGKPLVVVQFGGGQVDDSALLKNDNVHAIVWAGYPGQDGGNALRDVLTGAYAIAGRLPATQYPANYINEVNKWNPNLRPNKLTGNPGRTYAWYPDYVLPMGYGLHYTKWSFSSDSSVPRSMSIDSLMKKAKGSSVAANAEFITLTFNVKNAGHVTSDYVGMLYRSTEDAGPAPYPIKQLVSYDRLHSVAPGKTAKLKLTLTLASVARVDSKGNFYIYPGDYTMELDTDSVVKVKFTLTGKAALLETLPMLPNDPVAIEYLGCVGTHAISGGPTLKLGSSNSPQICADKCAGGGYSFSGVNDRQVDPTRDVCIRFKGISL